MIQKLRKHPFNMETLDDYQVISHIASGAFGSCSKIKRKADGKVYVWKEISYGKMSHEEKHLLVSEVNILQTLRHPHIVTYCSRINDKLTRRLYIVMEYCGGGDLATRITTAKKHKQPLTDCYVSTVLRQLCDALAVCHARSILHRDVKPANVFLLHNDSGDRVKLGDFGVAKQLASGDNFATTFVGTPYYMSPEVLSQQTYHWASDMWSLGCVLYEMLSLRRPFTAPTLPDLARLVRSGAAPPLPPHCPTQLREVVPKLLQVDPGKRVSASELKRCLAPVGPGRDARGEGPCLKRRAASEQQDDVDYKKLRAWQEQLVARESELRRKEKEIKDREDEVNMKACLLKKNVLLYGGGQWSPSKPRPAAVETPSPRKKTPVVAKSAKSVNVFRTPLQRRCIPKLCYT